MADPPRLLLVRHGESEGNAAGRWQGHTGGGLTARGREQARATAEWLGRHLADCRLVARSDLQRVVETAAPLERLLQDAALIVDPRLRELDVGWWAERTSAEVAAADPAGYAAWQGGDDAVIGGAERLGDLRRRVRDALDDLATRMAHAGASEAVVVTHGGVIRAAVSAALSPDGDGWTRVGRVANCSITTLSFDGGRSQVVRPPSDDHLPEGLRSPARTTGART